MSNFHIYPSINGYMLPKRYLTVGVYDHVVENVPENTKEDTVSFSFMLEGMLSEKEIRSINSIVVFMASRFHRWGLLRKDMQVVISQYVEGKLEWEQCGEDRFCFSLCAETPEDWRQVIFQLAYVFTDCLLHVNGGPKNIPWIEETLCEMMQLFMITEFARCWKECALSEDDPDYAKELTDYFAKYAFEQDWEGALEKCTTKEELETVNRCAHDQPDLRIEEVIHLYYLTNAEQLQALMNYTEYKTEGILLDCESYRKRYPNSMAVKYLTTLQKKAVH